MKLFLICLFFLALGSAFAQQIESVSIDLAPSFTRSVEKSENIKNPFAIAYGAGIHAGFKFSDHFSINTGLQYRMKAIELKDLPDIRNLVDASGNIDYSKIEYVDSRTEYNFIGISLKGKYTFSKAAEPKAPFYVALGLECSNLFWKRSIIGFSEGTYRKTYHSDGIRLNTSIYGGVGMLFHLSERTKLFAEPGYAFDFYAYNFQYDYKDIRFQSIQLTIGITYLLKEKKS